MGAQPDTLRADVKVALLAAAIFGMLPAIMASAHLITRSGDIATRPTYLLPATLVALPWLILGPALTVFTERYLYRTVLSLEADESSGWDMSRIRQALGVTARGYWGFLAFAVAVALAAAVGGREPLRAAYAVEGVTVQALALLVVLALGTAAGSGIYGMALTVALLIVSTRPDISWRPFDPEQAQGVEALSRFGYWAAVALSISSLQAPVFLRVASLLPSISRLAIYLAVSSIFIAGLGVFLLSNALLHDLNRRQVSAYVQPLAQALNESAEQLRCGAVFGVAQHRQFELLLALQQAVRGETATPFLTLTLGRAAVTVVIPLLGAVVPLLAAL